MADRIRNRRKTTMYQEIRGWGIVKPVIDLKVIGPLCYHPYPGHKKGCSFGCRKKLYTTIVDPNQDIWALYFSMNLEPLYNKLRKWHPEWSERQVRNIRYWVGTKKKNIRKIEYQFLAKHPGPWARVLNRNPHKINYTFGIWYNKTMEQIGVELKWPPEPHPITVQFLGRPVGELSVEFILK